MVVLVAEVAEAFGDRFQARPLRLIVERVVGVGAVDDFAEQHEGGIAGQLVFFQDRLERALLAVMAELDVLHVVGNGVEALGLVHHLVGRGEDELGVLVDEFPDQPGAGDAVDLHMLARDPFHGGSPFCKSNFGAAASSGGLMCRNE